MPPDSDVIAEPVEILHIGQGDMLTLDAMPDRRVEAIVKALHRYVLVTSDNNASQAFCLLTTALGDFIARTDAPLDLVNMAIDLLLEQRDELIDEIAAALAKPAPALEVPA